MTTTSGLGLFVAAVGRLREVPDVLPARPLRVRVVHRVEKLVHEARGHVHAGHDYSGHVAFLDLVVEAREGQRELVVGEADVREVRVDAGHHVRVGVDVQLSLLALVLHAPTIYPWTTSSRRAALPSLWLRRSASSWPARSSSPASRTRAGSRRPPAPSSRAR